MKLEDVPQDKGYMIEGKISDLSYALDEEGHYTSTRSTGWSPKFEAMKLALDDLQEQTEEVRKQVLDGKLSPIAYYMALNFMDVKVLSGYTGISRWRTKRHLKVKNFMKLDDETLSKYAGALNISVADLLNLKNIPGSEIAHDNSI
jgi:hypothetical protein